jgi:hypothetical protein
MKKYLFIFNVQTAFVIGLSLVSAYISLHFQFKLFIDFLIMGLIIAFPITFTMREAFKRRERALQYLSLFKASLQSVYYSLENSKLEKEKKLEFKYILAKISEDLLQYLSRKSEDHATVQQSTSAVFEFIRGNKDSFKRSYSVKILLFISRVNESIEFLIATRRHQTPQAVRYIILVAIYLFAILYPASLLNRTGFQVDLWYVFAMTVFKVLILIFLYNIQSSLEDPFNQNSPDGIKLMDFQFSGLPATAANSIDLETTGFLKERPDDHEE